jgi:tRNA(Ile)-lysidine synthase
LLALTRKDILAYLDSHGLTWCDDATNRDLAYTRNYIREALLPAILIQHPKLTDDLRALSQACLALYTLRIEPRVQALFNAHVDCSQGHASVPVETLTEESTLVLVELMRHILASLQSPLRSVTQSHYRALVDLIRGRATNVTLPGQYLVTLDQGHMQFLQTQEAHRSPLEPLQLVIPGSTHFGNLSFLTRLIKASDMNPESRSNRFVEYFDLQKLRLPLHVRSRTPGDRFVPLGRHAFQKVGKFLSRAQIKGLQRRQTAILSDDSHDILWICPVRMAEKAKVTQETEKVLEVSLRIDPEI